MQASLGEYRLIRRLGHGGMAEVFLASSETGLGHERYVALKRVLPRLARDPQIREMMLAEARLAASLNHPNLVEAYDIGIDGDACFFTMELVRGKELRALVRALQGAGGRLPHEHAISIAIGVANGLHHAHESAAPGGKPRRLVHLDVCPSNVLVTYEGFIKLIDFGIAHSDIEGDAPGRIAMDRPSVRRGTMAYMSPEQVRGDEVDRRSDIFSLGVILWELTTWSRLFRAPSRAAVFDKIVNYEAPPPSAFVEDYPEILERIITKALRRDPDARYQDAQELQLDLEDYAVSYGLPATPRHLRGFMHERFDKELRILADHNVARWAKVAAFPRAQG